MAIEQVAEKVVEEVALNLEEAAEVTRHINTAAVASFMGGTGFGILLGFWYGMRFNRERIRQEAFEESQKEVESIKAQFRAAQDYVDEARHSVRASLTGQKPDLESIVEQKGYDVPKTDYTRPSRKIDEGRSLAPLVPIIEVTGNTEEEGVRVSSNVPVTIVPTEDADQDDGTVITYPEPEDPREPIKQWNQALEASQRNGLVPYVIHRNEYGADENGYETKNCLYYSHDHVLVDDDSQETVNIDRVVGANNLKWGYGSGDPDTVFVRNDKLRVEMEIHRIDESYEGEVLGLDTDESD